MTRLGDKIHIEPLDDLAVARVEREVLAAVDLAKVEPERSSWWSVSVRWAVPAVAVAGVALAIFLNVRSSLETPAVVSVPDSTGETTKMTTGSDTARLDIGGAVVVLGPDAEAELIRHDDGGTTVVLTQGRVDCEVEPRGNRPPFIVDAGEVEVKVVGTVFAVERDGDDVSVEVTRGKVEVANSTGNRHVAAGEKWNEQADRVVALGTETQTGTDTDAEKAAEPTGTEVAVAAPKATERNVESRKPDRDRPRPSKSERPAPASKPARSKRSETTGPVTLTRPPRGTAPAELEDIRAIETRDPVRAAELYWQVAYKDGKGNIASYAMYSLAYLQMFELGQPSKAIETAAHYRRRFRKGRESRAALWLGVRATCKVGSNDDCSDAAQSYVARYPSGRHADQARWMISR